MAEDIRRFNRGEAILAKPLSRAALFGRAAWRHKEVTLALLMIVIFGISALGYTVNESHRVAIQQVQDQQQRLTEALDNGRKELGLARTAVERLNTFGTNDFQTRLSEARQKTDRRGEGVSESRVACAGETTNRARRSTN